jgi:hypothetical protein
VVGDDGIVKQTLSSADLFGKDQFGVTSGNTVRIHPLNPDLLLVSAELLPAAAATASKETASKQAAGKDAAKAGAATVLPGPAFFLYEIRSKRRVLLSPPNMLSTAPSGPATGSRFSSLAVTPTATRRRSTECSGMAPAKSKFTMDMTT